MQDIPVPPHQIGMTEDAKVDRGGFFPSRESARSYEHPAVRSPYGQDRVRALRRITQAVPRGGSVLDFGAGDGAMLLELGLEPIRLIAVDPSEHMLDLIPPRFPDVELTLLKGSTDSLSDVGDDSIDVVIAANSLNYVPEDEHPALYAEFHRILSPGGSLVVLTGNELLDLFALNSGTADFFRRNFGVEAAHLLRPIEAEPWGHAPRENPLAFGAKLSTFGFEEQEQAFSQWHVMPPGQALELAGGDSEAARTLARDHDLDPGSLPDPIRWQALFRCSMFASRSVARR